MANLYKFSEQKQSHFNIGSIDLTFINYNIIVYSFNTTDEIAIVVMV